MGWVVKATPRPLYPRVGGPQGRYGCLRKISPPTGILFVPTSFCLLSFCFCYPVFTFISSVPMPRIPLSAQTSVSPAGFFKFSFTLYFIRTCFILIILHFAFLSLLTTYNTNIHALSEIRTRNSSKRSAAEPRLRQLGHWDRHFSYRPAHSP